MPIICKMPSQSLKCVHFDMVKDMCKLEKYCNYKYITDKPRGSVNRKSYEITRDLTGKEVEQD